VPVSVHRDPSKELLYHEALYTSGILEDKEHTLLMTQTAVSNSSAIFLDYFTYTPSNKSTRDDSQLLLDDHDERITYSPGWNKEEQQGLFVMHTMSSSTNSGSSFQVEFEGDKRCLLHNDNLY
jgi:hypothetical protein